METGSYHSFYKILMDLTDKLGLPEGFTDKYDEVLPNAKLRIASGATWEVRVEKLGGEGYFFTSGWTKFCRDMKLEMLEILVFSYDGNSTFHVSVFAKTAFEKKSNFRAIKNARFKVIANTASGKKSILRGTKNAGFKVIANTASEKKSNLRGTKNARIKVIANTASGKKSNFRVIKSTHFKVSLKKHNRYFLHLPSCFVEASGLTNKTKVRLEYAGGKGADVELKRATRINCSPMRLGTGLCKFWKANRLNVDKTYSFEFIPNKNVIRVEPAELEEEIE